MAKTTYEQMGSKIACYKNFEGNSVIGVNSGKEYSVYSYNTEIFRINKETGKALYRNYFYSSTTTKVQYIIKQVFKINVMKPNTKTVVQHELFCNYGGNWHVLEAGEHGRLWDTDIHKTLEA